jgi:uncharacterized protein HemX
MNKQYGISALFVGVAVSVALIVGLVGFGVVKKYKQMNAENALVVSEQKEPKGETDLVAEEEMEVSENLNDSDLNSIDKMMLKIDADYNTSGLEDL